MPMYSYSCVNCDTDLDRIVKIADRDKQRCDSCGYALVRGIDRPGLVWAPTASNGAGHK